MQSGTAKCWARRRGNYLRWTSVNGREKRRGGGGGALAALVGEGKTDLNDTQEVNVHLDHCIPDRPRVKHNHGRASITTARDYTPERRCECWGEGGGTGTPRGF
jgi:hypothetical protein